MTNTITAMIHAAAERNPAAVAVIHQGKIINYQQLLLLLGAAAKFLHEQGIKPGDVVGLTMDRTPLHLIVMLALGQLGACSIPLSLSLTAVMRTRLAAKYGLRAIVTDRAEAAVTNVPTVLVERIDVGQGSTPWTLDGYKPKPETPFRVNLTSGTTGEPKGILFSHEFLIQRIDKALEGFSGDERLIVPDLHIGVGSVLSLGVLSRGGAVIFTGSNHLRDTISAVQLHAATRLILSPWAARQLLALLPSKGLVFPLLRELRLVGAAPGERLLRELLQRVTPHIQSRYAMTELGILTATTPESLLANPACAGYLRPGVKAEAVESNDRPLPRGTRGQLRFAIPSMPEGYFCDETISREKFRGGWFYSGDIGHINAESQLFIEGRVDDLLNVGGHKILPQNIEEVLTAHEEVNEAVAFLIKGPDGENILVAAVIPHSTRIASDLQAYCRKKLGLYTPEKFFIMREFPRTASGKIIRSEISRLAQAP